MTDSFLHLGRVCNATTGYRFDAESFVVTRPRENASSRNICNYTCMTNCNTGCGSGCAKCRATAAPEGGKTVVPDSFTPKEIQERFGGVVEHAEMMQPLSFK